MKNLRDKRITINRISEITERNEPIATVWAHYRSMSVKEGFECGADFAWNNVYFTITKPQGFELDTYCTITYNGNDYDIEGVDLFEDEDGKNIRIHARCRY